MQARLGKPTDNRLLHALTVCAGIEAMLVLRDISGVSAERAREGSRWTAPSLLRESLANRLVFIAKLPQLSPLC